MTSHSNPFWGITPGEPPFVSSPTHPVPDFSHQNFDFANEANGEKLPFAMIIAISGGVFAIIAAVAISTFLV